MHVYQAHTHPPWSANIVLLMFPSSLDSSCWTVQPPLWLGCHSFWQSSGCDLWRWDRKWNWSKFQTTARCTWDAHPLGHVDTHYPPPSLVLELCNPQETTCWILHVVSRYTAFSELLWGSCGAGKNVPVFNKPCTKAAFSVPFLLFIAFKMWLVQPVLLAVQPRVSVVDLCQIYDYKICRAQDAGMCAVKCQTFLFLLPLSVT